MTKNKAVVDLDSASESDEDLKKPLNQNGRAMLTDLLLRMLREPDKTKLKEKIKHVVVLISRIRIAGL